MEQGKKKHSFNFTWMVTKTWMIIMLYCEGLAKAEWSTQMLLITCHHFMNAQRDQGPLPWPIYLSQKSTELRKICPLVKHVY